MTRKDFDHSYKRTSAFCRTKVGFNCSVPPNSTPWRCLSVKNATLGQQQHVNQDIFVKSISPLCPSGCGGPAWPWQSFPCRWSWAGGSCRCAAARPSRRRLSSCIWRPANGWTGLWPCLNGWPPVTHAGRKENGAVRGWWTSTTKSSKKKSASQTQTTTQTDWSLFTINERISRWSQRQASFIDWVLCHKIYWEILELKNKLDSSFGLNLIMMNMK